MHSFKVRINVSDHHSQSLTENRVVLKDVPKFESLRLQLDQDIFDAVRNGYCPQITVSILDAHKSVHEKWRLTVNQNNELKIQMDSEDTRKAKMIDYVKYKNIGTATQKVHEIMFRMSTLVMVMKERNISINLKYAVHTPKDYTPPSKRCNKG